MEPLSKRFRVRPWRVFMATFVLVLLELFIGAVLPFESLAFGSGVVVITAITLLGAFCALCTRLELEAEGDRFILVVRLLGTPVIHRSVRGVSWHVVTRPGSLLDSTTNQPTFCRVEVADFEGNRSLVMGEVIAFCYGVECL